MILFYFFRIKLSNGQLIDKLCYRKKVTNKKVRNTLIPWCLAHTADKHNHWAGLYGRLIWKGFFPTIVTSTNPILKQGQTIHPDQHRVISIREMARAQSFPDDFLFFGTTSEKYSQIGNAVPPILSVKLAHEFLKCIQ